MKPYISADIGGSHITCVAVDPESKHIIEGTYAEKDVDSNGPADDIINAWADCLQESINKAGGLSGIGLAMPGPFDYTNGISKIKGVQKFDNLYDVDIKRALSEALELPLDCPVRFVNDATAFAMGEAWAGKAAPYKKMMAITLGTGFGSAFLEEGVPVLEGETVPDMGCVYHLPYQESIADDYFSTRWFVNSFNAQTGASVAGVKEIADLANSGDAQAVALFKLFGSNLAEFLGEWMRKFGVECLVIGGNISNAGKLFIPTMKTNLDESGLKPDIFVSELKEDAALLGAAHLVEDTYYGRIEPLLKLM
jgi:glucokinase